jgi:hypothetical protein
MENTGKVIVNGWIEVEQSVHNAERPFIPLQSTPPLPLNICSIISDYAQTAWPHEMARNTWRFTTVRDTARCRAVCRQWDKAITQQNPSGMCSFFSPNEKDRIKSEYEGWIQDRLKHDDYYKDLKKETADEYAAKHHPNKVNYHQALANGQSLVEWATLQVNELSDLMKALRIEPSTPG